MKAFATAVIGDRERATSRAALLGGDDAVGHVGVGELRRCRRELRHPAVRHAGRVSAGRLHGGWVGQRIPSVITNSPGAHAVGDYGELDRDH